MPAMPLKMCAFEYQGGIYGAMVTEPQRQAILKVVQAGGDVFGTIASLIGAVNLEIFNAYNDLAGSTRGVLIKAPAPPVLGCCVCDSGKIPNLTQTQCDQFNPISWGEPADCTGAEP